MKIAIIGPGKIPIPPTGWGAIESIIWDYYCELKKHDIDVRIFNQREDSDVIAECNAFEPDFVHIQIDSRWQILQYLNCRAKAITTHHGYLEKISEPFSRIYRIDHFENILKLTGTYNFCLSNKIKKVFQNYGFPREKLIVIRNGVNEEQFSFSEKPVYPDRSIYLAMIQPRKRQALVQSYDANVWFAGKNIDSSNFIEDQYYLGEWDKKYLVENLTNYSNLILLSDGEADPLVTKEAMVAGLGLVLSEAATANLDLNQPFITVVPETEIKNSAFVKTEIEKNRIIAAEMRSEIRKHAIENFSWKKIIPEYINIVKRIIRHN
jgi:glycosyltransferase involved in cell wall biosynthesis